jgi:HEAT repeat protein
MKIIGRLVTAAAVIVLAIPGNSVRAQSLSATLSQLNSNEYETRRAGFYRIRSLANADNLTKAGSGSRAPSIVRYASIHPEVASALITLLERENLPDPAKESLTEDAYYGDLIGSVAALKDPRAVNALLGAVQTGRLATNGLASLGQAAVPGLLAKLHSQDHYFQRSAAVETLGSMLDRRALALNREMIRLGLLRALSDPNPYVRSSVVRVLVHFSDPDVRHAMERLASRDTTAVTTKAGTRVYPIRSAALGWLRHDDSVKATTRRH